MHPLGVIHGRFQVLHNDHLAYLLAGKKRCRHLVVGITNPDPGRTKADPADPARSSTVANPLTYYERHLLVRRALTDAGTALADFSIVPMPINFPDLLHYYVPMDAVFFLSIYDQWGEKKLALFKELGLRTEILWRRQPEKKGLSSAAIRDLIAAEEAWKHYVPGGVAALLDGFGLPERIRAAGKDS